MESAERNGVASVWVALLRLDAGDERFERRELLWDELAGGLVLKLKGLVIKLGRREPDEDLRRAERERVEERMVFAQRRGAGLWHP
jgi:hypothetical protein